MHLARSIIICGLVLCNNVGIQAQQVCAESGWYAGLDGTVNGTGSAEDSGATYILHQYGEITCAGVISDWTFYKSIACNDVKLRVWEDIGGGNYRLLGENLYDASVEGCQNVQGSVTVYIPAHEQIPVSPGDIIGWSNVNPTFGRTMIKYSQPVSGPLARNFGGCNAHPLGDPTTGACSNEPDVAKSFHLQAHVRKGLEPDIANLPYTVQIPENVINNNLYEAEASHEKNNVHTTIAWWDPTPVTLTFSSVSAPITGLFDITRQSGSFGNPVYTGIISNRQQLDFEQVQQHNVTVTVTGQGLQTSGVLTVQVLDMNEAHTIDNLPDTIDVSVTGVSVGDEVFQVTVSDPDTINPQTIEYFITDSDLQAPNPEPPFTIDQFTGQVIVSEDVRHWYLPTRYVLEIVATDYMHDVRGQLTIDLIDTKSPPVITNLDSTISLPEDAPDGSDIFQVLVSGTPKDTFLYTITGVLPVDITAKFGIHQDGWIFLTQDGDLDFYDHPVISIGVQVFDGELSDVGTLTINLDWVNEAPVFQPRIYRATIPEMCGQTSSPWAPCVVTDVTLSWEHRDTSDPVTCAILPSHGSDRFQLISGCTQLNITQAIDVNTDPSLMKINLTITLSDRGPPTLGDTARVFISVYDINDNVPVFNPKSYASSVKENTPGGVSLFTVSASDQDFDRNGEITYSISGTVANIYFQIHPLTGVLSTKHPVEYDGSSGHKSFNFSIIAKDRGIPPRSSLAAPAVININDTNDNKPIIDCWFSHTYEQGVDPYDPNYHCFYNLDVRYDILINHNLMTFNATDLDALTTDPNFFILNVEPHFRVDNLVGNGYLFTEEKLYKYHMYSLIVEAHDMGDPNLKARPPAVVRVDTFDGPEHLVDITLGNTSIPFNKTLIQTQFIQLLREYCHPWVIRLYAYSEQRDRTIITIYGLEDNTTFLHSNFDEEKHFVSLSNLLQKLRSDLKGTPRPDFEDAISEFIPLEVQPTYPKFLIHTLGGWITLFFLFLLLFICIIIFIVCLCRCFSVCCFRKRLPTKHAWMKDKPKYDMDDYDTVSNKGSTTVKRRTTIQTISGSQNLSGEDIKSTGSGWKSDDDLNSGHDNKGRRPSVDTVHSLIYDTGKK